MFGYLNGSIFLAESIILLSVLLILILGFVSGTLSTLADDTFYFSTSAAY